jgi:hypothetical protein
MKFINLIKNEFINFLFVFIFFLFFFLIINVSESLLLKRAGLSTFSFIQVSLAAFLIAKVIVVSSHFKFTKRYDQKPLCIVILWKTVIHWIILLLIRFLLAFLPYLMKDPSYKYDANVFMKSIDWGFFLSIQSYYLMLLFIFETFDELTRKIGKNKMKELFFGKR